MTPLARTLHPDNSIGYPGETQVKYLSETIGASIHEGVKNWCDVKQNFLVSSQNSNGSREVKDGIRELLGEDGIMNEDIIAIPWYYKEESSRLIQVIANLKGNFTTVLYFNGVPEAGSEEFIIRFNDIKRILEQDGLTKKIILVKHAYHERVNLGVIRGDMIQGIIEATSDSLSDPVVYGLDADTYSLKEDYITNARQAFNENESVDFLRSQLRWTNSSKEGYVWLSEMLMHLGNMVHNRKHVISMGGATSFRLRSYVRIDGYKKSMDMGEDIHLGKDMKEGNPDGGRKFGGKVYVDPRRGIESVHMGKRFQDQWLGMKAYSFVEKDGIFTNEFVSGLNEIIIELISGKSIELMDISQLCGHLESRYFVGKRKADIRRAFIRFWNINQLKSLYIADEDTNKKLIFIKKDEYS